MPKSKPLAFDDVRKIGLALPGVEEGTTFGATSTVTLQTGWDRFPEAGEFRPGNPLARLCLKLLSSRPSQFTEFRRGNCRLRR